MNPVTNAMINQWSSDVDRMEKELAAVRRDLELSNARIEQLISAGDEMAWFCKMACYGTSRECAEQWDDLKE